MNTNIDRYKPKTYFAFTTNALRNNVGDGTLEYYKKYESPFSSFTKADEPFSADHPEFFYCNEFTVKRCTPQSEIIDKARKALGNIAMTQRKNTFYREEVILLLSCNDDGEFDLDVIYYETNTRKWTMEPFADLAEDSEFTEKQTSYVVDKLVDFYNVKDNNPKAKIRDLQKEYLT